MNNYNLYSYPEAKNVVVCGDIHGEFNTMIYKLCVQYQMTDTLLIVAGDCGFGFAKPGFYENIFRFNTSRLSKANNWVVLVRGNHDDPAYFREERRAHQRYRTVPDYSVVQACGHNILCVGGAISIDRSYRKDYDASYRSFGSVTYWADEAPVYNEQLLNEMDGSVKIDTVITHTAPSFCELISKDGLSDWSARDAELLADCGNERMVMDLILAHLKAAGHLVAHWFYGHFHQSWNSLIDGVQFSMLDIMEFKELR